MQNAPKPAPGSENRSVVDKLITAAASAAKGAVILTLASTGVVEASPTIPPAPVIQPATGEIPASIDLSPMTIVTVAPAEIAVTPISSGGTATKTARRLSLPVVPDPIYYDPGYTEVPVPGPLSPETSAFLQKNARYIGTSRCSGFTPVADNPNLISTAVHCLPQTIQTDDAGNKYIDMTTTPVYSGNDMTDLHFEGDVSSVIMPANELSHDLAYLVLNGADPEAALKQVTAFNTAKVIKGDTSYAISAWPAVSETKLERWPATALGIADVNVAPVNDVPGKLLTNMVILGIKKNTDGLMCSPGSSGGGIVKTDADKTIENVGNMSFWSQLHPLEGSGQDDSYYASNREFWRTAMGIENIDDFDAICGVSSSSDGYVIASVHSGQIPAQVPRATNVEALDTTPRIDAMPGVISVQAH